MDFTIDITNQTIGDLINYVNSTNQTNSSNLPLDYYDVDNLNAIYGPKRDPLYVVIPITFIYMVIFVTGVVGNISTCIVISRNKSMHTATNYYLFSLAVSDFLLLISGVPQEVYSIWHRYPYVFGEVFCVLRGLMAETSANATVLTITSFTVERYLAICHPFLQHTMSKLSRAIKLVIIVWIVSILLAIPQALQFGVASDANGIEQCFLTRIIIKHSFELSTLLFFMTPMTLITVLYILIGLKLRTSGLMKRENGVSMQRRVHVNSCRQQPSVGTRRVLKMLVAVVVTFFFCWAPFHAQRLVAFYGEDQFIIYAITTYVSGILYYLSTCINPLLYNIMSNKFREAFKESLATCCQLPKRSNDAERSYRILSRSQRRHNGNQESGDYSGSSIRDESVHSTVTQKQSTDTMTIGRDQSSRINPSNKIKVKPNDMDNKISHHKMNNETRMLSSKRLIVFETYTQFHEDALAETPKPKSSELSAGQQVSAKLQSEKRKEVTMTIIPLYTPPKRTLNTRSVAFFRNLFNWSRHSSHLGFYSPPLEHPIGKTDIHLSTTNRTTDDRECVSSDDGEMSNSSLKNVDRVALEDELASYMEEIRQREKR